MARFVVPLEVAFIAGCSCCPENAAEYREYPVDDVLVARLPSGCIDVCNVLAGRTEAGSVDSGLVDAGASPPPMGAVSGCFLSGPGPAMRVTCEFGFVPCAR